MKNIILILLLLPAGLQAATVNSSLESVRIFLWGAEINRTATASVEAGIHEVVFTSLPQDIKPNSVQVSAKGAFTILSVSHRNNYLQTPAITKELQVLQDSLDYFSDRIAYQEAMLQVYEQEESLLLANKSITGGETTARTADLKNLADFFRSRMGEVKELQLTTKAELKSLRERHEKIRQQIGSVSAERNSNTGEIVVTTSATRTTTGQFSFSYITTSANWQPMYDIRAADTNNPVELLMKASVKQKTGEDWNNIQMVLSTANPLDSRVVPSLDTWFLQFLAPLPPPPPPVRERSNERYIMDSEMRSAPLMVEEDIVDEELVSLSVAELTITSETNTTREYHIPTPYNIPSGSDAQMVEVQKNELPAVFTYYAIPRAETNAYLVARVVDWEEYVILPGGVGIFFENSWVGKTYINPFQVRDTLEFSMGTDRSVAVERNRMEDYTKKSILGRRTTETVAWEIVVRNGKTRPVTIEIKDQIPVSADSDIQVSLEEKSGAEYTETSGILQWRMELSPGETARMPFRYSVKYPSDKRLRLE